MNTLKAFGRSTGKQVRQDLLRRVRTGNVRYARKLTGSRTVIVLEYAGEELAFLYSSATRRILCFLPPGAPETEDWRHSRRTAQELFLRP